MHLVKVHKTFHFSGMTMFQAFNFLLLILTQSIPSGASSFPLIGEIIL